MQMLEKQRRSNSNFCSREKCQSLTRWLGPPQQRAAESEPSEPGGGLATLVINHLHFLEHDEA